MFRIWIVEYEYGRVEIFVEGPATLLNVVQLGELVKGCSFFSIHMETLK